MKIAVYKNDEDREPYLVHHINSEENLVSLGLKDFPDTEQDWLTEMDEIEFLKKGTDEFKQAKKEIKKSLA